MPSSTARAWRNSAPRTSTSTPFQRNPEHLLYERPPRSRSQARASEKDRLLQLRALPRGEPVASGCLGHGIRGSDGHRSAVALVLSEGALLLNAIVRRRYNRWWPAG